MGILDSLFRAVEWDGASRNPRLPRLRLAGFSLTLNPAYALLASPLKDETLLKTAIAGLLCGSLSASPALGCSDVLISGNGFTAVARALDFPGGGPPPASGGVQMGYVPVGAENTSNINMPQTWPLVPVTWKNTYAAIGQVRYINAIHDGINSAGLYVARQNLPAAWTRYPMASPGDIRPELGAMDVPSYLLGTSATAEQALLNLSRVQIVMNAPMSTIFGETLPLAYPYHLIVRDKYGSSLVVEWIEGKTHTYYHSADARDTIEQVNFGRKAIHRNFQMAGITNEPPLSWQIGKFHSYRKLFDGNDRTPIDGQILMSTGYMGLPGDYSSPSRFARLNVLSKFVPAPSSSLEAETAARSTLTTVVTPISGGGEFTLWTSLSNLTDMVYYWSPVVNAINTSSAMLLVSPWNPEAPKAIRFDLQHIMKSDGIPKGFVVATIQPGPILSAQEAMAAIKNSKGGDNQQPGAKVRIGFSGVTTVFDPNTFDVSPGSGISYQ